MRVLHVNTNVLEGGAGRACYRLHTALRAAGQDSRVLSFERRPGEPDVIGAGRDGALWDLARRLRWRAEWATGLQGLLDPTRGALDTAHFREADLVNLHNLHGFALDALLRIDRAGPWVWTFHDAWPLTGRCAFMGSCTAWRTGCGCCTRRTATPAALVDASSLLYRAKARIYRRISPVVVCPSEWLLDLVRQSELTRGFRSLCIPNGVDTGVFRPQDRAAARAGLGLAADERVLLVVARQFASERKGADLLAEALRVLRERVSDEVRLVVAGEGGGGLRERAPYPVIELGHVGSEAELAQVYSAADALVLPTRADNLPNVLLESLACGTPCVSFCVGGVPEAVRPGVTGWLAEPGDAAGLARCLTEALTDDTARRRAGEECRRVAEREYDVRLMARRYLQLYEELLAPKPVPPERAGRTPRVMVVAHHLSPSTGTGARRSTRLARFYKAAGAGPVVVTAAREFYGDDVETGPSARDGLDVREVPYRAVYDRLRAAGPLGAQLSNMALLAAYGRTVVRALRARPRPDLLHFCGNPFWYFPLGRYVKLRFGIDYVLDLQDLYYTGGVAYRLGHRGGARMLLDRIAETLAVGGARLLVLTTEEQARIYRARYPGRPAGGTITVRWGYDAEVAVPPRERRAGHAFRIVIFGKFAAYGEEDARTLAGAVRELSATRAVEVVQLGRPEPELEQAFRDEGLAEVFRAAGMMPYAEGLAEVASADCAVLKPISDVSLPAKVYDYVYLNRPVLAFAAPGSALARLLAAFPGAFTATTVEEAARALRRMAEGGVTELDPDPHPERFSQQSQFARLWDALTTAREGDA